MGGVIAGISLPIEVMVNCALPPNGMVAGSMLCSAVPDPAASAAAPIRSDRVEAIQDLGTLSFTGSPIFRRLLHRLGDRFGITSGGRNGRAALLILHRIEQLTGFFRAHLSRHALLVGVLRALTILRGLGRVAAGGGHRTLLRRLRLGLLTLTRLLRLLLLRLALPLLWLALPLLRLSLPLLWLALLRLPLLRLSLLRLTLLRL